MRKKIICSIIITMFTLCITGCGTGLAEFAETNIPNAIRGRAEQNISIAKQYRDAGIIDDKMFNEIEKEINSQTNRLLNDVDANGTNVNSGTLGNITTAVSSIKIGGGGFPSYIVAEDNDGTNIEYYYDGSDGYGPMNENGEVEHPIVNDDSSCAKFDASDPDTLNYLTAYLISNYIYVNNRGKFENKNLNGRDAIGIRLNSETNKIQPIKFISDSMMKQYNDLTQIEVYALRADVFHSGDEAAIDGVVEGIQTAINQTRSSDKQEKQNGLNSLSNYFTKLIDDNGDVIHLINEADKEKYEIFCVSKNDIAEGSATSEPGHDLPISQNEANDIIRLQFQEFNNDAFDNLSALIGMSDNYSRYYIVNTGHGTFQAYLIEYPIYVINALEQDSNDIDKVNISFKESELALNLKTGNFVKHNENGESQEIVTDKTYLTINGAENNTSNQLASIMVKGYAPIVITDSNNEEHETTCGRLVLRDYLEATYAPGFDNGASASDICIFGRKIRLRMEDTYWNKGTDETVYKDGKTLDSKYSNEQYNLSFPKKDKIGEFVDVNGERYATSSDIRITDLVDARTLLQDTPKLYKLPDSGEDNYSSDGNNTTGLTKIDDLPKRVGNYSIKPTLMFPGEEIGLADYNSDEKQKERFYALTTSDGLFKSALFSNWINSTSTQASLEWWNNYLNEHGFIYELDHDTVNEVLRGEYTYELGNQGIIIIDLETISKIQEIYNEESDKNTLLNIRTMFMIGGWVLIIYSSVLMLCWAIDANADIGIKLLGKLTFGHYVAVKYESDIPYKNTNDVTYLTAGKMLIRCLVLMAVGLMLIMINIYTIVAKLIEVFGGIAIKITEFLQGLI